MSSVQRGGDGPRPDLKCLSDRFVVEIREVTKEESQPLSLWQCGDRGAERSRDLGVAILRMNGMLEGKWSRDASVIAGRIDDDTPHPGVKWGAATEGLAMANNRAERLLDDIPRSVPVTDDRCRHATELRETGPVHGLDLAQAGSLG
jgi:hypothetical protein